MVDVLEQIKPMLTFESDDVFYYLQILQRKKENPQLGSNSRVIKNYYIGSHEYLESHYEEIKELCRHFNARAMLRLNKRSYEKVAYKSMVNIANSMQNKEFSFIKKSYDRAVGNGHSDPNKTWILDIDGDYTENWMEELIDILHYQCKPYGPKVVCSLPTKNGIHLIIKPCDIRNLYSEKQLLEIDLHKDNPINLYIP